jgi:hypothetical protein
VKALAVAIVMALAAALGACTAEPVDTPEVAAKKEQCRALEAHMFRISPQAAPRFEHLDDAAAAQLAASMAAALPPEDIDQCVAAESEILACMEHAQTVREVKQCIPSNEMLDCLGRYTDEHDKRHHCGYRDPFARRQ